MIRTVCGDIAPEQLGVTYMHEHLYGYSLSEGADPDLRLDSEVAASLELSLFKQAGGNAVVEMSPQDYNRNPQVLKRLSETTGIHIIAVTGFIKGTSADPLIENKTINQITDELVRDVSQGIDGTDIKAGLLKGGSSLNKITANEEKILRAVARAQRETGTLISTHTEAGTMALEQIAIFKEEGANLEKVLIGHTDRNLDYDYHVQIANTGVTLGYDQFSKEKYAPDHKRIEFMRELFKAGYGKQIAISGDLARRSNLTNYGGGPGYTFLLWRIKPWLRKSGFSAEDIEQLFAETPRRLLTLEK
ncbi:MAG: phosphotriesterase family protein [Trueperaceae bacterium]